MKKNAAIKNNIKTAKCSLINTVLLGFVLLIGNASVFCQEKINISAGYGLPQLLNVGVRYQLTQTQIGISIGAQNEVIAVTGDYYQHIAGSSQLSTRRPFYTRIGLTYLRDEDDIFIDKYVILALRVGRDFNLSENAGIQLDIGGFFNVLHFDTKKLGYKYGRGPNLNIFIPAFGITLFYRI